MWIAAVFIDWPNPKYQSTYDQIFDTDLNQHLSIIFYQGTKDDGVEYLINKYKDNIVNYELFQNQNLSNLWLDIKKTKDTMGKIGSKTIDDILKTSDVRIFRKEQLSAKEGFYCIECHEYYEYATANQTDGTFICCGCKLWKHVSGYDRD